MAQPRAADWTAKSVFEKWFAGSTGDPPVPSGDSPDETGATVRANGDGAFATLLAEVPVGGSPTGAGGSPAQPIFKTGSKKTQGIRNNQHARIHSCTLNQYTLTPGSLPPAMGEENLARRRLSDLAAF